LRIGIERHLMRLEPADIVPGGESVPDQLRVEEEIRA
jgi:hypothetical protein